MTEKIYLHNPYIKEIKTRITEKYYKNDKYFIETEKTIFHPNLIAGQPRDKGTINGRVVLDVFEEDNKVIHVLKDNINSDMAFLKIDWDNRLDYMQQHSAQHLLSAAFYKLFNSETLDFYIGEDKSYIDLDINFLEKNHIEGIEEFVNRIIFSNFSINTYITNSKNTNDKDCNIDNSQLRIVEIDSIDFSPCLGTHLRNTGEIGVIKILEFYNKDDKTRIEFVAGKRALGHYNKTHSLVKKIYNIFNCKTLDEVEDTINTISEKNKLLKYENSVLYEENLNLQCLNLIEQSTVYREYKFIFSKINNFSTKYVNDILDILTKHKNNIILLYSDKTNSDDGYSSYIFKTSNNIKIDLTKLNVNCLSTDKNSFTINKNILYGKYKFNDMFILKEELFQSIIKKL